LCGAGRAGDGLVFDEGVEDGLLVAGIVGNEANRTRLRVHGFFGDSAAYVMVYGGAPAHGVGMLLFCLGVEVVLGEDSSDHVQGHVLRDGF
jgi:hypothetical protein